VHSLDTLPLAVLEWLEDFKKPRFADFFWERTRRFFTYTLAPFLSNITSNIKTCTISHLSEQIDKIVHTFWHSGYFMILLQFLYYLQAASIFIHCFLSTVFSSVEFEQHIFIFVKNNFSDSKPECIRKHFENICLCDNQIVQYLWIVRIVKNVFKKVLPMKKSVA
jgi:hypothetical protein